MYSVKIISSVEKKLSKMDKSTVRLLKNWIVKNLVNTLDPRRTGKQLKGDLSSVWRYRVGDYRIFANIEDDELIIFLIDVGHRKDIYRK